MTICQVPPPLLLPMFHPRFVPFAKTCPPYFLEPLVFSLFSLVTPGYYAGLASFFFLPPLGPWWLVLFLEVVSFSFFLLVLFLNFKIYPPPGSFQRVFSAFSFLVFPFSRNVNWSSRVARDLGLIWVFPALNSFPTLSNSSLKVRDLYFFFVFSAATTTPPRFPPPLLFPPSPAFLSLPCWFQCFFTSHTVISFLFLSFLSLFWLPLFDHALDYCHSCDIYPFSNVFVPPSSISYPDFSSPFPAHHYYPSTQSSQLEESDSLFDFFMGPLGFSFSCPQHDHFAPKPHPFFLFVQPRAFLLFCRPFSVLNFPSLAVSCSLPSRWPQSCLIFSQLFSFEIFPPTNFRLFSPSPVIVYLFSRPFFNVLPLPILVCFLFTRMSPTPSTHFFFFSPVHFNLCPARWLPFFESSLLSPFPLLFKPHSFLFPLQRIFPAAFFCENTFVCFTPTVAEFRVFFFCKPHPQRPSNGFPAPMHFPFQPFSVSFVVLTFFFPIASFGCFFSGLLSFLLIYSEVGCLCRFPLGKKTTSSFFLFSGPVSKVVFFSFLFLLFWDIWRRPNYFLSLSSYVWFAPCFFLVFPFFSLHFRKIRDYFVQNHLYFPLWVNVDQASPPSTFPSEKLGFFPVIFWLFCSLFSFSLSDVWPPGSLSIRHVVPSHFLRRRTSLTFVCIFHACVQGLPPFLNSASLTPQGPPVSPTSPQWGRFSSPTNVFPSCSSLSWTPPFQQSFFFCLSDEKAVKHFTLQFTALKSNQGIYPWGHQWLLVLPFFRFFSFPVSHFPRFWSAQTIILELAV